jgi:HEAT repeat protein
LIRFAANLDARQRRIVLCGTPATLLLFAVGAFSLFRPSHADDANAEFSDIRAAESKKNAKALAAVIQGADARRSAAAVGALARIGGSESRAVVRQAITDTRWEVRQQAVQWFPRLADPGDARDIQLVTQTVRQDKSNDVVIDGLKALGEMKAWDSIEQVFEKMNHPDRSVRLAAAEACDEILFINTRPRYAPDDPVEERTAAIQFFRQFTREPGRRAQYMSWLAETKKARGRQG